MVGEQPILVPGKSFEYTSGCPLSTPQVSPRHAEVADRSQYMCTYDPEDPDSNGVACCREAPVRQ